MPVRTCGTLQNGGVDDGTEHVGNLQVLALQLRSNPARQHSVKLGTHYSVAEAAQGRGVRKIHARFKPREHHEVDARLERLFKLSIRQIVPFA